MVFTIIGIISGGSLGSFFSRTNSEYNDVFQAFGSIGGMVIGGVLGLGLDIGLLIGRKHPIQKITKKF